MSSNVEKTEFEKMLEQKIAAENDGNTQSVMDTEENTETAAKNEGITENQDESDAEVIALTQKLQEQSAQCEQAKDQLLRVRADFDNYRKRMAKEMNQVRQTASANLIRALLPAMDNLERALAHATAEEGFVEGVGMVYKQLQEILAAEGLEPVPALHEVFDPNVHDALATTPSPTVESGRIVEEFERGYRLRDMVLRPAKVVVSSGVPEEEVVKEKSKANEVEATEKEVASEQ